MIETFQTNTAELGSFSNREIYRNLEYKFKRQNIKKPAVGLLLSMIRLYKEPAIETAGRLNNFN